MVKSSNIYKYVLIVGGGLVLLVGLALLALPPAQADLIVPLVRNTPTNEAYTLVGKALARSSLFFSLVLIPLGTLIVSAATADLRTSRKDSLSSSD